ncbi:MAG: CBS domain-containing protein [Anaerolineales bacterium]
MKSGRTVLEAKRLGVVTCPPEMHLARAAALMVAEDISSLVVTNTQGYLVGIVTRMDLLRAYLRFPDTWADLPVADIMSREVITVSLDTTLHEVAQILMERHIHRVVVVEPEGDALLPLAVLSDGDLIYHLKKDL